MESGSNTPRAHSRSRPKRSTTNLANLRLAPLSTKYEAPCDTTTPKSPYRSPYVAEEDAAFARQHPSYLHGKSAPTTPSILSRSSSRRHLGGGLSRKNSIYDNDYEYEGENEEGSSSSAGTGYGYTASNMRKSYAISLGDERAEHGDGHIPKAKSEAALLLHRKSASEEQEALNRLSGPGVPLSKRQRYSARRSGGATPREREPENWLTHTGASTAALVQEGKGLSWLTSRQSSTSLAPPTDSEEDEDDDHYEEMAALSASTARLQLGTFEGASSPVSTRVSRWGSRYGSRNASRKTSRLASPVGTRTPRRGDQVPSYFDLPSADKQPDFIHPEMQRGEEIEDEKEIIRLNRLQNSGLGSVVDRLMSFNLFAVNEGTETTDDESGATRETETVEQAKERIAAENLRRKEEKEKLTRQPTPAPLGERGEGPEQVGGWQDAAWLLSVASKAIF